MRWMNLALPGLLLTACDRPSGALEASPRPTVERGALALAFVPGPHPTERAIERAQARMSDQPSLQTHLALARLFMRRRRETSKPVLMLYARDAIDAALELQPDHAEARILRGLVHQYDHEFRAARALAESVLVSNPSLEEAQLLRGDAALELGDYHVAAEAYQAAVDHRPGLRSYNRAAHMSWLFGHPDGALELLKLAIDSGHPGSPESTAWCLVDGADIHRRQGRSKTSLDWATAALRFQPNYGPALVAIARAHAKRGEAQLALEAFERAVRILPTVDTLLEMSELYREIGHVEEAAGSLEMAEALSADDPRPMAHRLARRGNLGPAHLEQALLLSQRALTERRNIQTWDTRALVLIRAGRLDEARVAMQRATSLGTVWPEASLHWALLEVVAGQDHAARHHLARALELDAGVDPVLVDEIQRRLSKGGAVGAINEVVPDHAVAK